jgi:hypothetical protein
MGSEIQPGIMRAQKREIQINRVTYLLIKKFIFSLKNFTFRSFYIIWNWQSFLQLFSKLNRKHAISFIFSFKKN